MCLLVLRSAQPDRFLFGERAQRNCEHGTGTLGTSPSNERISVFEPDALAVLVLNTSIERLTDDRLGGAWGVALLGRLRLSQPLLALEAHLMECEGFDRLLDDLVNKLEVTCIGIEFDVESRLVS